MASLITREQSPHASDKRLRSRLSGDAAALADGRARFSSAAAEGLGELARRCVAPESDERPPLAEVGCWYVTVCNGMWRYITVTSDERPPLAEVGGNPA